MISSLNGKLLTVDTNTAVVECGGVGFRCFVTGNTVSKLPTLNSQVFLHTYLVVREDAMDLYGFYDNNELNCFKLLTSVSGIGPKMALALLSEFTPDKISLLVLSNDAKGLTAASGIGLKGAQRIILELKDKLGSSVDLSNAELSSTVNVGKNANTSEAVAALTSLGFTQSEATLAVGKLDPALKVDELIKLALKTLSTGR